MIKTDNKAEAGSRKPPAVFELIALKIELSQILRRGNSLRRALIPRVGDAVRRRRNQPAAPAQSDALFVAAGDYKTLASLVFTGPRLSAEAAQSAVERAVPWSRYRPVLRVHGYQSTTSHSSEKSSIIVSFQGTLPKRDST